VPRELPLPVCAEPGEAGASGSTQTIQLAIADRRRTPWGDVAPAVSPLDVSVAVTVTGVPRFETSLVPNVREARLLTEAPWIRGVGSL